MVGAALKTECAFLESRDEAEVIIALSDRGWARRNVALLSETERIGSVQFVGSDAWIETWRSK